MSFGDFSNSKGLKDDDVSISLNPRQSSNDGRYKQLCDSIRSDIFAISSNLTRMRKLTSQFGTDKDTHDMRDRLNNLQTATQDIIRNATSNFKSLSATTTAGGSGGDTARLQKLEQQKLKRDFQQVVDSFQQLQRTSTAKSREFVARARAKTMELDGTTGEGQEDDESTAPLMKQEFKRQQELIRLDNEIEFNENIIMEREQSIREIETAVHEVNEIFRDLGSLVTEQQGMLDNIESNIESAATRTGDANIELQGANTYQRRSRNRMCFLLAILAAVVVLLGLIFALKRL